MAGGRSRCVDRFFDPSEAERGGREDNGENSREEREERRNKETVERRARTNLHLAGVLFSLNLLKSAEARKQSLAPFTAAADVALLLSFALCGLSPFLLFFVSSALSPSLFLISLSAAFSFVCLRSQISPSLSSVTQLERRCVILSLSFLAVSFLAVSFLAVSFLAVSFLAVSVCLVSPY
ncbi:ThiF family protein, partial [Toxoplasma gondii FOU]